MSSRRSSLITTVTVFIVLCAVGCDTVREQSVAEGTETMATDTTTAEVVEISAEHRPNEPSDSPEPSTSQIWFSDSVVLDLTGDSRSDTVIVLATGSHQDSLRITLTIQADGIVYRDWWTSAQYLGPEGYSNPDEAVRRMLDERSFGRLDPIYDSAERYGAGCPDLIAEQTGGTVSDAEEIYREMLDRRMPVVRYSRGVIGYEVAWSPSQRRFFVLVRAG